jgi:PhnB protein
MQFIPYLAFDGDCREAFDFYQQVFGGQLTRMTFGDSPMAADMPPETHGKVMHSMLDAAGALLMGADLPPGTANDSPRGCVNIQVATPGEAERVFAALADGASIQMPLQPTFWAQRFGMLTDRHGQPWLVNCLNPMSG